MHELAQVHLLTLGVDDVARATRFYERLGWRRSSASQPDISFLQGRGIALALWSRAALARDARVAATSSAPGALALAVNVGTREGVDDAMRLAQDAGATVTKPAEDTDWGGRSGYLQDPDGHVWEVAWNPHFPFASDGSLELPM